MAILDWIRGMKSKVRQDATGIDQIQIPAKIIIQFQL